MRTQGVGTVHWMPPEAMRGLSQGPPVDVYAFGVVLYEMAAEMLPYIHLAHPRQALEGAREQKQYHDYTNRASDSWPSYEEVRNAVLHGGRPDESLILPQCPPIFR